MAGERLLEAGRLVFISVNWFGCLLVKPGFTWAETLAALSPIIVTIRVNLFIALLPDSLAFVVETRVPNQTLGLINSEKPGFLRVLLDYFAGLWSGKISGREKVGPERQKTLSYKTFDFICTLAL